MNELIEEGRKEVDLISKEGRKEGRKEVCFSIRGVCMLTFYLQTPSKLKSKVYYPIVQSGFECPAFV